MSTSEKKTRGRQKVKMVRMEKKSNCQVTFSKRRTGLFKKASELCTLCGAQVAIIVFSPGKKAYSFGHPSVETVINRFLLSKSSPKSEPNWDSDSLVEAQQGASASASAGASVGDGASASASVRDLTIELATINYQIDLEMKKSEALNKIKKRNEEHGHWWDQPAEKLTLQQLVHLKATYEVLKKNIIQHSENLKMLGAPNAPIQYAMFDANGVFIGYRQDYY
ncbi:hypothetical protein SOVF_025540 [Spinacia oleracea]|uniref:Agamous-like MADS-box protein AGL62 n=1 Tax=Spinacia oleracea TaxID=3562 RepID=A0A9R0J8X2_SPIOL|nr:agamous-like MADS-box protein AGL62 [Spinacia oleracea]KNA23349.1 hypothetical protein SOVF_025540 [Spinacia oleracea]